MDAGIESKWHVVGSEVERVEVAYYPPAPGAACEPFARPRDGAWQHAEEGELFRLEADALTAVIRRLRLQESYHTQKAVASTSQAHHFRERTEQVKRRVEALETP